MLPEPNLSGGTLIGILAGSLRLFLVNPSFWRCYCLYSRQTWRWSRTYQYLPGEALLCPIYTIAGEQDLLCPPSSMAGWQKETMGSFFSETVVGNHFFINSAVDRVRDDLESSRVTDLPPRLDPCGRLKASPRAI